MRGGRRRGAGPGRPDAERGGAESGAAAPAVPVALMGFDPQPVPAGGLHAAATERNRPPILAVLQRVLPPAGVVLELASGAGRHATFFAAALPALRWEPSAPSPARRQSVAAWAAAGSAPNVAPPVELDVERWPWSVSAADQGAMWIMLMQT